jgi:hypothetical protein
MIRRILLLAGVAALAMTGCGATSPSITRLRAQATRVCKRAEVQSARIAPPPVPARTAPFLRRGIAVLRVELADLHTLRVPRAQAGAYSVAVGALAHELAILTSTAHDLDRGADPLTTIKTLQHRLAPVEADDDAAWRTLGVPACVNR